MAGRRLFRSTGDIPTTMVSQIIVSLFLTASAYAQQSDMIGATFRDFSGGLVDSIDASALQPNQSPNLMNVVIDDPAGSLKPRNGFAQCGLTPSGATATALYEYAKSDGSKKLIVSDNTTIWQTADCVTFSTVTTGLTSTSRPSFATVRDKLWIVNGTTWPFTWDGTTKVSLDGTGSSPNPGPPNGRYIEFWKERVWIARTGTNPSLVQFSALTDSTGGDLNPSTGTTSWPATDAFYIDQEGGSPIYGMKAFRDRLYIFKNNGIWEIKFETDFINSVVKTYSSVGSRFNTAIKELDGQLYFAGPDGIYSFDGDRSIRISDMISNTYKSANQLLSNELFNIWNSNSDFSAGTSSRTEASNGSVILLTQPGLIQNGNFETGTFSNWIATQTGTGATSITSPTGEGSNTSSARVFATCNYYSSGGTQSLYVYDSAGTTRTTVSDFSRFYSTQTIDTSSYVGQTIQLHFAAIANAGLGEAHLYSSTFTARNSFTFVQTAWTCSSDAKSGWQTIDWFVNSEYVSSGTQTSEVFNAVTVSTWSTFDATYISNGGSLQFYYRTGTSNGAIIAASWIAITPGAVIDSSVDRTYIQWKAEFGSSSDLSQTPELEEVSISYFQGGDASKAIFMESSNNRLWVSVATGSASNNNLVLVKSKHQLNSWSQYDLPIGPMTRYNDNFYAASSTDSKIHREEYGTNDNGSAIQWYWQSRDETWNLPNNLKYLLEVSIDYRNDSACNMHVGYSKDSGSNFCAAAPIAMNVGAGFGSKSLYVNGGQSYSYRLSICNDSLDEHAIVTGLTAWARPQKGRF